MASDRAQILITAVDQTRSALASVKGNLEGLSSAASKVNGVLAGLGAVVMMFTFVVPKFAALLKRADDLPWLASAVLNTGMFLRQWYAGVLLLVAALVAWLVVVLRNPETRARWLERLERLPVLGAWRVESETATWARVLATLLSNRVPLMDALGLARASTAGHTPPQGGLTKETTHLFKLSPSPP